MRHPILHPFGVLFGPLASWVESELRLEDTISTETALQWYILFVAFWALVYLWASRRYRHKSGEYASRVVSLIHSVLSVVTCGLAALDGFHSNPRFGTFGDMGTGLQQIASLFSAAYFAVDTVGICLGTYFSWLYIGHHIVCGGCLTLSGFWIRHGYEFTVVTSLLETSNPFLHARWLMIEDKVHLNKKKSWMFSAVENTFYVIFFIMRFFVGPFMTYDLVTADNTPIFVKCFGFALQVVSLQFMYENFGKKLRGELWIS